MAHILTPNCSDMSNDALIRNPVLVMKISKVCEIEENEVSALLKEVMIFLSLIHKYGEKLTPSLIVDYAWHELILCTQYYHEMCQKHFGRYIHHHPGGEEKENHKQYIKTINHYIKSYGKPPVKYWGKIVDKKISSSADCGMCEAF